LPGANNENLKEANCRAHRSGSPVEFPVTKWWLTMMAGMHNEVLFYLKKWLFLFPAFHNTNEEFTHVSSRYVPKVLTSDLKKHRFRSPVKILDLCKHDSL